MVAETGSIPPRPTPTDRELATAAEFRTDANALERASGYLRGSAGDEARTIAGALKIVAYRLENPSPQGIA